MATEQNKAVLRRWMEGWKTGSSSVLEAMADEVYTADAVFHDPSFPDIPPGPEGARQFVHSAFQSTPDIRITLEDVIAEGDKVACRFTVSGTDAPTGKPMALLVMAIVRFVGGKIAEEWEVGVPVTQASTPSAASETHDPLSVVEALDTAVNEGNIERVMALFADDAVLKDPVEPKVYTGKQQIREWFRQGIGRYHVTSTNRQVTGNMVTWHGTLTGDFVREMGSDALEETAEAIVQGGRITSFALTIVGRKP